MTPVALVSPAPRWAANPDSLQHFSVLGMRTVEPHGAFPDRTQNGMLSS